MVHNVDLESAGSNLAHGKPRERGRDNERKRRERTETDIIALEDLLKMTEYLVGLVACLVFMFSVSICHFS